MRDVVSTSKNVRSPGFGTLIKAATANPSLMLSVLMLALVLAWAAFPQLFTSQNPLVGIRGAQLIPPGAEHWLGTDELGRDSYARIVYGARNSLSGALIAVMLGLAIGVAAGVIAGTSGGMVDAIIMRIVDVMLAIPSLLLSLSFLIILGFGHVQVAIAIGITSIASFSRLARSEVVSVQRSDYVEAAGASGGKRLAVIRRHVIPNSLRSVLSLAALQFGAAILQIATLGFLGYGAPPPTPEWGLLIAEGRSYISSAWWLTPFPGLVVIAVVLAANRVGATLGNGR